MSEISYQINNESFSVSIEGSPVFQTGKDQVLSQADSDITFGQPWYNKGYAEEELLNEEEFDSLKQGLTDSIKNIIERELKIDVSNFELENYHKFVTDEESHFKIVSKTRDLFPADFSYPIMKLTKRLGNILGFNLTDEIPQIKKKLHIIIRINRPKSNDFNPPHKDTYEVFDQYNHILKFMNFWIPIVGVTENSSLPIAPESHKINESSICRTIEGGFMQGNKYRVRMIKSWNNDSDLIRSTVKYRQVLMFSSHLIHGLAINNEEDKTRVALEFRLFKSDDQ